MPVRKIPRNHLQVTGRHATTKSTDSADFESILEKEHLLLLDNDPSVLSYEVQPVKIPVPGVRNGYTPDLLVHFCPNEDGCVRPSEIREVKKSDDFKKKAGQYAPKFEAAEHYAASRGWVFRKVSEEDIRTPRLANLKFLSRFRFHEPEPDEIALILSCLDKIGRTTSDKLLEAVATSEDLRLQLLPVLWHLVISGQVGVDLDKPLGNSAELWHLSSADG